MFYFRENGLEKVITLVKGKAETVPLPVDKVNIKKNKEISAKFLNVFSNITKTFLKKTFFLKPICVVSYTYLYRLLTSPLSCLGRCYYIGVDGKYYKLEYFLCLV